MLFWGQDLSMFPRLFSNSCAQVTLFLLKSVRPSDFCFSNFILWRTPFILPLSMFFSLERALTREVFGYTSGEAVCSLLASSLSLFPLDPSSIWVWVILRYRIEKLAPPLAGSCLLWLIYLLMQQIFIELPLLDKDWFCSVGHAPVGKTGRHQWRLNPEELTHERRRQTSNSEHHCFLN